MGFIKKFKKMIYDAKPTSAIPEGKTLSKQSRAWELVKMVCRWLYNLRSLVLAIPVVVTAVFLAIRNTFVLPQLVGINLQATGEYAMMVDRGIAVLVPLLLTGVCVLLMFVSKRVVYPWLISVFSLAVPYLVWLTNIFPA